MTTTLKRLAAMGLPLLLLLPVLHAEAAATAPPPCPQPGWFPSEFGLKDHTVFQHEGVYYLAAIYLDSEGYEDRFAYAASPDLCQWEDLGGILQTRPAGAWDEFRIWAPDLGRHLHATPALHRRSAPGFLAIGLALMG